MEIVLGLLSFFAAGLITGLMVGSYKRQKLERTIRRMKEPVVGPKAGFDDLIARLDAQATLLPPKLPQEFMAVIPHPADQETDTLDAFPRSVSLVDFNEAFLDTEIPNSELEDPSFKTVIEELSSVESRAGSGPRKRYESIVADRPLPRIRRRGATTLRPEMPTPKVSASKE
jgi:hypothetical protein